MPNYNSDLSYSQPTELYVKKPIDLFLKGAVLANERYEKGLVNAGAGSALLTKINVRDVDQTAVNEVIDPFRKALEAITEEGDYENYTTKVGGLAMKLANDPLLLKAIEKKQQQDEWLKSELKRPDLDASDLQANYRMAKYNAKPLKRDPETGYITDDNSILTPTPKNVDIYSGVIDIVKKLEPTLYSSGFVDAKSNDPYLVFREIQKVDPALAQKAVFDYITLNPDARNLLTFRARAAEFDSRLDPATGQLRDYGLLDVISTYPDATLKEDGSFYVKQTVEEEGQEPKEVEVAVDSLSNYLTPEGTPDQSSIERLRLQDRLRSQVSNYFGVALPFMKNEVKTTLKDNMYVKSTLDLRNKIAVAREQQRLKDISEGDDPTTLTPAAELMLNWGPNQKTKTISSNGAAALIAPNADPRTSFVAIPKDISYQFEGGSGKSYNINSEHFPFYRKLAKFEKSKDIDPDLAGPLIDEAISLGLIKFKYANDVRKSYNQLPAEKRESLLTKLAGLVKSLDAELTNVKAGDETFEASTLRDLIQGEYGLALSNNLSNEDSNTTGALASFMPTLNFKPISDGGVTTIRRSIAGDKEGTIMIPVQSEEAFTEQQIMSFIKSKDSNTKATIKSLKNLGLITVSAKKGPKVTLGAEGEGHETLYHLKGEYALRPNLEAYQSYDRTLSVAQKHRQAAYYTNLENIAATNTGYDFKLNNNEESRTKFINLRKSVVSDLNQYAEVYKTNPALSALKGALSTIESDVTKNLSNLGYEDRLNMVDRLLETEITNKVLKTDEFIELPDDVKEQVATLLNKYKLYLKYSTNTLSMNQLYYNSATNNNNEYTNISELFNGL